MRDLPDRAAEWEVAQPVTPEPGTRTCPSSQGLNTANQCWMPLHSGLQSHLWTVSKVLSGAQLELKWLREGRSEARQMAILHNRYGGWNGFDLSSSWYSMSDHMINDRISSTGSITTDLQRRLSCSKDLKRLAYSGHQSLSWVADLHRSQVQHRIESDVSAVTTHPDEAWISPTRWESHPLRCPSVELGRPAFWPVLPPPCPAYFHKIHLRKQRRPLGSGKLTSSTTSATIGFFLVRQASLAWK